MNHRPAAVAAARRVLVRLPNWLGDAVMARPLLHALRRGLPDAEIRAVAPAPLLDLLGADGVLDRGEPWPAGRAARETLARSLRFWGPEIALVLPPSFSSAWFVRRTGARVRVGTSGEFRGPLLTVALPRPARGEAHVSEGYLELGAAIGVAPAAAPPLALSPAWEDEAAALLESESVGPAFAILAPGAVYGPAKRWAPERYAAVGRALIAAGREVLVCGAASDRPIALSVAGSIGIGSHALAGRTSIGVQAVLCAHAAVVVSNDSGLAHVAAATGAPTVAVFGSTSSAWTAPRGPRVRVVQHAPVCAPCFRRTCRIGYRCLEAIAVAEVLGVCDEVAA